MRAIAPPCPPCSATGSCPRERDRPHEPAGHLRELAGRRMRGASDGLLDPGGTYAASTARPEGPSALRAAAVALGIGRLRSSAVSPIPADPGQRLVAEAFVRYMPAGTRNAIAPVSRGFRARRVSSDDRRDSPRMKSRSMRARARERSAPNAAAASSARLWLPFDQTSTLPCAATGLRGFAREETSAGS
jgi:hypothetical protein